LRIERIYFNTALSIALFVDFAIKKTNELGLGASIVICMFLLERRRNSLHHEPSERYLRAIRLCKLASVAGLKLEFLEFSSEILKATDTGCG
jgi:hypothetical protein